MNPVFALLAALGLLLLLLRGFHGYIRRGLAPQRLATLQTPGDLGLAYREVRIPTANGLCLAGWFLPAEGAGPAPVVVLLHGWSANSGTLLPLARPLHQAGFTLLFFDARCHGRSDEDRFTSLPRFAEDLEHALIWLASESPVDGKRMVGQRIALVGHSVGAGAALLVASRRDDIAALASIAAFSHPERMMRRLLAARHIPFIPFGWYILGYVQRVIGQRFDDIAPIHTIRKVRCPTLLVHGAEDRTVPVAEARAIHGARAGDHVQLKIIPGSHDEYGDIELEAQALVAFMKAHVPGEDPDVCDRSTPLCHRQADSELSRAVETGSARISAGQYEPHRTGP